MPEVLEFKPIKHVYNTDHCSGCQREIVGSYTELGLPSGDGKRMEHIALCKRCATTAQKQGVI
ncbi:hypothetical protein ACDI16_12480 [Oceanobacillus caeni]